MAVIHNQQKVKATSQAESRALRVLIAAALAVLVAVITINTFGIRYQTNDDATLANIAAGAYGDTLHMVYVNVLFSLLLRPLYAVSAANWYVIVQLLLVVVSLAVMFYLLQSRFGTVCGTVLSAAVAVGFAQHIFYTFQYTECSFIMIVAGLLLITDRLGGFDKQTWLGIFLVLMGSMVRWTSFYAAGALAAPLLLYSFFTLDTAGRKKAVATMLVLFALTFGAKAVDVMAYKTDPRWDSFTKYNAARTQYSDFRQLHLPEDNPFEAYGISDADYAMLNSWDFYDKARFDTPLLEQLSAQKQDISVPQLVINTLKQIKRMLHGKSYHFMFLAAMVFALAHLRPKWHSLPLVGVWAMFGLLMLYLTYEIRFPEWVELGMIWSTVAYCLYRVSGLKKPVFTPALAGVVLAAVVITSAPSYIELYNTYQNYENWTKEEQHFFEEMSRDKDNIYLLSTTSINLAAGFDVAHPRTEGFYSNIVAFGGWLSRAPHRDAALAAYGLERPLVDAVDRPDVYLDYHNISNVVAYVSQELGCEVYAVKNGTNAFTPYQLTTQKPQ